ncbi:hypothetical protein BACCAP_02083 [Pseudoflavonifractor capillosus ATCC 29799]|uniref:Uncharacterized protein n=1 Tax=Pseudoflavonifractor capillosus ATCC 29799 TaxID=411467 RepID=A6NV49_9FIRM|nr:hypothetical protein BACCAP_02083 [Pseudoflavonifractor capillosus ATCC 29799]
MTWVIRTHPFWSLCGPPIRTDLSETYGKIDKPYYTTNPPV